MANDIESIGNSKSKLRILVKFLMRREGMGAGREHRSIQETSKGTVIFLLFWVVATQASSYLFFICYGSVFVSFTSTKRDSKAT